MTDFQMVTIVAIPFIIIGIVWLRLRRSNRLTAAAIGISMGLAIFAGMVSYNILANGLSQSIARMPAAIALSSLGGFVAYLSGRAIVKQL